MFLNRDEIEPGEVSPFLPDHDAIKDVPNVLRGAQRDDIVVYISAVAKPVSSKQAFIVRGGKMILLRQLVGREIPPDKVT